MEGWPLHKYRQYSEVISGRRWARGNMLKMRLDACEGSWMRQGNRPESRIIIRGSLGSKRVAQGLLVAQATAILLARA